MGYEVKIHVLELIPAGRQMFSIELGTFDISNPGSRSHIVGLTNEKREQAEKPFELELSPYAEEGDTRTEDLYGEALVAVPIEEYLDALGKDRARDSYRRFDIAHALLSSIHKHFQNDNIVVVPFGH